MADRLPDVPRIFVCLVEADIEDVVAYCRGEASATRLGAEQDDEPSDYYKFAEIYELHGDAAQVDQTFGPELSYLGQFPHLTGLNAYPLRGWRRVSRLRSNPRFVLWEESLDTVGPQDHYNLQFWTGGRVIRVLSQISDYPMDDNIALHLGINFEPPEHSFTILDENRQRSVSYGGGDKKTFWQKGDPWGFEDVGAYRTEPPRKRIGRDRICHYLEKFEIDPEATFERRELDDPVLFTTDHEGVSATIYPELADRYNQLHEPPNWIERIADGRWF